MGVAEVIAMSSYTRKTNYEPPARDRRKLEPAPQAKKLTGKSTERRQARPYGYAYQYCAPWRENGWEDRTAWFETAKRRDQSMAAFQKKAAKYEFYRLIGSVDRLADNSQERASESDVPRRGELALDS